VGLDMKIFAVIKYLEFCDLEGVCSVWNNRKDAETERERLIEREKIFPEYLTIKEWPINISRNRLLN